MSKKYQIINARIVNEGRIFNGCVLIDQGVISRIIETDFCETDIFEEYELIDAAGNFLIPGVIDDQVHFRDPGLTHKADLASESAAAVAGGVTSFMDMPNSVPNTLTQDLLEEKYQMASKKALANYSFYMGVSNDNLDEVLKTDPSTVCGIKVFLGASTGNMLVDNKELLEELFAKAPTLIAVHCEHEPTVQKNWEKAKKKFGDDIPISEHPNIRSEEACYLSSSFAVGLAKEHNTRLHVLHISTAKELELFEAGPLENKCITSEVCVHHLWFNDSQYDEFGTRIKWNPAIKTKKDQEELFEALFSNKIDVIATDHAPHTLEEKQNKYDKAPSGGPLVQHSLVAMLEFYRNDKISIEKVVEKMCHAPAKCYQIEKRGFIREGYHADLVIVNTNDPWVVAEDNILYKCKWSPLEGTTIGSKVVSTFVNGNPVYHNGEINKKFKGTRLKFDR
ncbi:MAG: dihydroorotase [Bacteroidetes bacterium]|nr:dihydroorotase [Bacteroidota bacterium]